MVFLRFPIDFPMNQLKQWWFSIGFWYVSRRVSAIGIILPPKHQALDLRLMLCPGDLLVILNRCHLSRSTSSERSRFWGIRSFQLDGFKKLFFYYWEMLDLRLNGFIYMDLYMLDDVGWIYPLVISHTLWCHQTWLAGKSPN